MQDPHLRCGTCLSEKRQTPLATCLAAVDYAFPWDQLIARFKFRQEPALARTLAELMLQNPRLTDLLQVCDWIIPIPVTPARLAERGYNQAWELAKALRVLSGSGCAPGWATALSRRGQAPDQHDLPAQQRLNNLNNAFHAENHGTRRLQGAHVLLIDDVSTTGTTLRTAARALLGAGAGQVSAAVFAHAANG
jgi:ComF family protein